MLDKVLGQSNAKAVLTDQHRERLQTQLKEKIAEIWDSVKVKVKNEWERQARDVMGEMYRDIILTKEYTGGDLQEYFRDWKTFE